MIGFQPKTAPKPVLGAPPTGRYTAVITDITGSRASTGTCDRIEIKLEITDGDFKGKNLWFNQNVNYDPALLDPKSPTYKESMVNANKISEEQMGGLLYALRMPQGWTAQTHRTAYNRPVLVDYAVYTKNDKTQKRFTFDQVVPAQAAAMPTPQQTLPPQQAAMPQPTQPAVNNNTAFEWEAPAPRA